MTEATATETTEATAAVTPATEPKEGPYVRVERSNRVTKATVGVYDSHHKDSVFERKGDDRWVTFCVTHNAIQYSPSIAKAWKFHAAPWDFCAGCAEIKRAKDQAPATAPKPKTKRGRKPKASADGAAGDGQLKGPNAGRPVARPPDEATLAAAGSEPAGAAAKIGDERSATS
jgi:hypothetical protein